MFEVFGRTGPQNLGPRPQFWTLQKLSCQFERMATVASRYPYQIRPEPGLAFILPLIAMLTKEPKMLQPDAICQHTTEQNATAAGALPRTLLGELTALLRPH